MPRSKTRKHKKITSRKHQHKNSKRHHKRKTMKQKNKTIIKNSTGKIRKEQCSPKPNGEELDFTCYSKSSIHMLKESWNLRHPDSAITSNEPREIWNQLKYLMRNTCNKESCWLRHQCIKHDLPHGIYLDNFSPKQPKEWKSKPTTWLTSIDIEKVMQQYEKKYSDFRFLGPSPIDYDQRKMFNQCVWEELCRFQLLDYKNKGITKIGVIFNLDPHTEDGSHWVALFINLKKRTVYYFDSYGDPPHKQITKFRKTVQKQAAHLGIKLKYKLLKKRHQYKNSECGMYCLYFIIKMLEGKPVEFFDKRIDDDYMVKMRNKFFNKR